MDRLRKWTNRKRSELSITSAQEYGTLKDEIRPSLGKGDTSVSTEPELVNLGFVGDETKPSFSFKTDVSSDGRVKKDEEVKAHEVNTAPIIKRLLLLFKYSDGADRFLLFIGSLIAAGTGLCYPLMFFAYADVISGFVYNVMYRTWNSTEMSNTSSQHFKFSPAEVSNVYHFVTDTYTLQLGALAIVSLLLGTAQYVVWTIAGSRQMEKIRRMYFKAVIHQSVSWFDENNAREISARFSVDLDRIAEMLGHKTALCIMSTATVIGSYVVAMMQCWQLALATLAVFPIYYVSAFIVIKTLHVYKEKEFRAYAQAGSIADEVFTAIRTVTAFNGQNKESLRYNSKLHKASKVIFRGDVLFGIGMCGLVLTFTGVGAVGVGYGMYLFQQGLLQPGETIAIIMVMLLGSSYTFHIFLFTYDVTDSLEAASKIYPMIDGLPELEVVHDIREIPTSVTGHIQLKDVSFVYPTRPDIQVLSNINIDIDAGQTVALVGHTGCGKTTVVQLIERFYSPTAGQVLLDGMNLNDLDVDWFRQQIGWVSQEPVLFATSIADNIKFGNRNASDEDIVEAATLADAHEFIEEFSEGYNTFVGERGCQLSGGQKQRIAIARALVRNPKILLLDEATSALDSGNEMMVQKAIEKAQQGRTTLIVAHRLSTVIGADRILVLDHGQVVEEGTHTELMNMDGHYKALVSSQIHTDTEAFDLRRKITGHGEDKVTSVDAIDIKNDVRSLKSGTEGTSEAVPVTKSPMLRLMKMNSPECHYIILGCICAILFNSTPVTMAVLLGESTRSFIQENAAEISLKLVGIILPIGICSALLKLVSCVCFGKAGANLTTRIRSRVFASLVRQDVAFYDDPKHQVGVLTNRLSNDATLVQGAGGQKLAGILENIAVFTFAVSIGLAYSWKLTLVVTSCVPVIAMFGILQGQVFARRKAIDNQEQAVSGGQALQECIANIRLVCAFSQQQHFQEKFNTFANNMSRSSANYLVPIAILRGLSAAAPMLSLTVVFTYGSYLIQYESLTYSSLLKVFIAIDQAAITIGRTEAFSPDFTKAKQAAGRLLALLDTVPKIDVYTNLGHKLERCNGEIELTSVTFNYPYRPDVPVLVDVSLHVNPGTKLAIVGSSGCGKSTISSLLERFYDPSDGNLAVDGQNIRHLNLMSYRAQVGLVPQEPVLFDCSVAENIKYGDNSREVPMQEVIQVSRIANLHDFVQTLPQGYDTIVGHLGTQMSGGEKQRIAIARALVQDPKILILDEATSALDGASEKVVQSALDNACKDRTTIVISHRLSTIRHADRIAVLHDGRIAETGTHDDLVSLNGIYSRFYQNQI